jgi:hypothetical protein
MEQTSNYVKETLLKALFDFLKFFSFITSSLTRHVFTVNNPLSMKKAISPTS